MTLRTSRHPTPRTGEPWLSEFSSSLAKSDASPRTIVGYRLDLELFFRWLQEKVPSKAPLKSLTPIDVAAYRQHLVQVQRLKAATINRRLQALRRFCRWAKRRGLAKRNYALVQLMLQAGLRVSELAAPRLRDLAM